MCFNFVSFVLPNLKRLTNHYIGPYSWCDLIILLQDRFNAPQIIKNLGHIEK